jgi:hypothetical protein
VTRKQKSEKPKKKHRLRRVVLLSGAIAAAVGYRNQRLGTNDRTT